MAGPCAVGEGTCRIVGFVKSHKCGNSTAVSLPTPGRDEDCMWGHNLIYYDKTVALCRVQAAVPGTAVTPPEICAPNQKGLPLRPITDIEKESP